MDFPIYRNGSFGKVNAEAPVRSFKEVTGFAKCNNLRNCLLRVQGGIWKIEQNGVLRFIDKSLNNMSFGDIYNAMKDQ